METMNQNDEYVKEEIERSMKHLSDPKVQHITTVGMYFRVIHRMVKWVCKTGN